MNETASATTAHNAAMPRIAKITGNDIINALGHGLRDMQAAPLHSLAFGLIYAAFGWLILFLMIKMELGSYTYPLATGFALVAPLAATGLYEISQRLEQGREITWSGVLGSLFGPNGKAMNVMIVVTTFAYIIWLDIAVVIYVLFFGMKPLKFGALLEAIVTTFYGFTFFVVGNVLGAAIALFVFSIMVVSLPLLFDRKVDFVTAMITSVKTVTTNPKPMLLWCAIIGVLLVLSLASLFIGLIFALPLLGHATWHLYRTVILPKDPA